MPYVEQLPSGKYRALYRDNAGKRRSAGTFDHKKKAESAAAVAEAEARKLGWRDPAAGLKTWGEWSTAWWASRAVEAGTLQRDAYRLNKYLLPRWADVPLAHITRHEVKLWATELGADLAPASVQRILYLLSTSLTAAMDAELITTNPAFRIRIVKGETTTERFLTRDEFSSLLEEIPPGFDSAVVSFLVGTGARWGEAVGAHVKRLDLVRGNLRIAEVWDDAMHRVKPYPKGRKIRDVPVPDWVLDQVETQIDGRTTGLLFEKNGTPPDAHNWRARVWAPAVKRANIGHTRIHDLRHTYASWLLQDGVPLAEVGKLLGHVSPITTQRYAHLTEKDNTHILRALRNPARGAAVGQPDTPLVRTSPDVIQLHPARSLGS